MIILMDIDTYVFIDAAYLSLIAKEFFGPKPPAFDINSFAKALAKEESMRCLGVYYYTAPPYQSQTPTKHEKARKANYDKFVSTLKKIPGFVVREGRCQKIGETFCQKGVDTLLTMDLARIPMKSSVRRVLLLVCDTDFVPILNELRAEKIEIVLFYFTDRIRRSRFSMSNHLLTACDKSILLEKRHFERAFI